MVEIFFTHEAHQKVPCNNSTFYWVFLFKKEDFLVLFSDLFKHSISSDTEYKLAMFWWQKCQSRIKNHYHYYGFIMGLVDCEGGIWHLRQTSHLIYYCKHHSMGVILFVSVPLKVFWILWMRTVVKHNVRISYLTHCWS